MHDALAVRVVERQRDFANDLQRLGGGERRLGDGAAGQEFHAQVGLSVVDADVVDADDVPVRQARGGASFAHETFGGHRVLGQARREQLQGDFAAERFLDGKVDAGHAAEAELADDAVTGNLVGSRRGHGRSIP